jgi:ribonuclease HI
MKLAEHNRVQLIWVPDHRSTEDNETATQLARVGSECPFTGPESACSFSAGVAKRAVTDWTNRDHKNTGSPQQNSNT